MITNKSIGVITILELGILSFFQARSQKLDLPVIFKNAESQAALLARSTDSLATEKLVSPRTLQNGKLQLVASRDWTSGFFPGELWFLYEYSKKDEWLNAARKFTANIEKEKFNGGTHDMGFKVYCSFGNGYLLTHDTAYKNIIVQAAKTVATRFNPKTGVIKSWDNTKKWSSPTIIDNMMNLELLFEAAKLSGDNSLYDIAVRHANTTLKNHFRKDYSSYHVVDYDSLTGNVIKKTTHQGYSDSSAWARGQSWALYGYTICYRETKNKQYLKQAEGVANYILSHPHLPEDLVPYWDFDAPDIPNAPRDASAAAVIASGLLELSTYGKEKKKFYKAAVEILTSLTNNYRAPLGTASGFILLHSTGARPSNLEVDAPLSYADYYYLEALLRLDRLSKPTKKNSRAPAKDFSINRY